MKHCWSIVISLSSDPDPRAILILSWSTTRSATDAGRWPKAVACISCSVTDRLDFEPFRLKVQQWRKLPSHLSWKGAGAIWCHCACPVFHLAKIHEKHHLTQPSATKTNRNLLQKLDQELEWAGYVGYVWPGMNWADRDTSAASRTTRRGRPPHATSAGSEAILRLSQGNTKDQPSVEQYAVGLCRIPVRDKAALCDNFNGRKGYNGMLRLRCRSSMTKATKATKGQKILIRPQWLCSLGLYTWRGAIWCKLQNGWVRRTQWHNQEFSVIASKWF